MLYTTRLQPRDKPLQVTRTATQSASSRPYENKTYLSSDAESWRNKSVRPRAYSNKPNPIKHWRKQLIPNEISGTSSRRMQVPFNAPGLASTVPIVPSEGDRVPACRAAVSASDSNQVPNILFQNPNKPNLEFYYHPERKVYSSGKQYFDGSGYAGRSKCTSCNPQVNIIKPTFGQTTKRINPILIKADKTTATTIPYSFDTKAYLRSKQKSYETNLTGTQISDRKYYYKDGCCLTKAVPPSNDLNTSSGVRKSLYATQLNYNYGDASRTKCCDVTYKPSNHQFGTQGSVSSSSRLERLKYNTLQASVKNPAVTEAWALAAANAGKYRLNGTGPYFMKAKRHICDNKDYVMLDGSLTHPGSKRQCGNYYERDKGKAASCRSRATPYCDK